MDNLYFFNKSNMQDFRKHAIPPQKVIYYLAYNPYDYCIHCRAAVYNWYYYVYYSSAYKGTVIYHVPKDKC